MNRRLSVAFWVVLGFCAGISFHRAFVAPAQAQEKMPEEKVISAQEFVLAHADGSVAGTFGFDDKGSPEITLLDPAGNAVWSTEPRMQKITR